ncbi:MAG: hypothetical protein FRX49_08484 [Trebouxia sp. A1-2]|nr:MAG: hypothetical protein FRX49_08484 [Trebouxia sp. A1-2]
MTDGHGKDAASNTARSNMSTVTASRGQDALQQQASQVVPLKAENKKLRLMAQGGKSPQEVGSTLCIGPLADVTMLDQPNKMLAHSIYQALVCRLMAHGGKSP